MAEPTSFHSPSKGATIQIRDIRRRDLREERLRERYWDQVHPRPAKKYRPKHYEQSSPWDVISEAFIDNAETKAQPLHSRWQDWVGGLYSVVVPLPKTLDETVSDVEVKITLILDFSPRDDGREIIQWTVNTLSAEEKVVVAYPGVHRGAIGSGDQANYYDLFWHTPIFSPYVEVERPTRWNEPNLMLEPVVGTSKTESRRSFPKVVTEEVTLPGCNGPVSVLQERLKDVARLLVYGPTYDKFGAEVREKLDTNLSAYDKITQKIFESDTFPEIAAFFSRAYCHPGVNSRNNTTISDKERQRTLKVIEALFERYQIIREPPWVKTSRDDWVDDIAENIKEVPTVNELLAFETKWASVVSYTSMLYFHEGPWAGDDWMSRVAA